MSVPVEQGRQGGHGKADRKEGLHWYRKRSKRNRYIWMSHVPLGAAPPRSSCPSTLRAARKSRARAAAASVHMVGRRMLVVGCLIGCVDGLRFQWVCVDESDEMAVSRPR